MATTSTIPIIMLATAKPFPLYLWGFFLILDRLMFPNTIAIIPSGIEAINRPTSDETNPAKPKPSTLAGIVFVYDK